MGDKQISDLFDGEVEITEKLDGSQFGFGRVDGELVIRSKGREIDLEALGSCICQEKILLGEVE